MARGGRGPIQLSVVTSPDSCSIDPTAGMDGILRSGAGRNLATRRAAEKRQFEPAEPSEKFRR